MKKLSQFLLFVLFALFALFTLACQFSADPAVNNQESPDIAAILWTADTRKADTPPLDKEVTPEESEVACTEQDSCVVVDKGCCPTEKRVAINWKSVASHKRKLREGCTALFDEEAKKRNHNICRGRNVRWRVFEESPRCHEKKCVIKAP